PGGWVDLNSGMLEKIGFYVNNKDALEVEGYTDPESGEFISYENVTVDDVMAAMIANQMAKSELSHKFRWFEITATMSIATATFGRFIPVVGAISGLATAIITLYFGRTCTYEADRLGSALVADAGYNPAGALFLNEVHKKCRPYLTTLLSHLYLTGPLFKDRQAVIFPVAREWKMLNYAKAS
ncbi:MAG: hypothetical protein K1060chlam2_00697, partial [Chlamydiae bacterium]|nr:hypothetical protein [Chlamydiota bacterium]